MQQGRNVDPDKNVVWPAGQKEEGGIHYALARKGDSHIEPI